MTSYTVYTKCKNDVYGAKLALQADSWHILHTYATYTKKYKGETTQNKEVIFSYP